MLILKYSAVSLILVYGTNNLACEKHLSDSTDIAHTAKYLLAISAQAREGALLPIPSKWLASLSTPA